MCDVVLLSGISGLLFDSPFLSDFLFLFFYQVLLLFLPCHFSANRPVSFFQKILQYFLLRDRLLQMVLAEQLEGSWYVQLVAV